MPNERNVSSNPLRTTSWRANILRLFGGLIIASSFSACTYLKYTSAQAEYARIHDAEPGQVNAKHMLDRETYFVHGRCNDVDERYEDVPKAIAAFSDRYQKNERVATMQFQVAGSHYGLNLPEGRFDLLVFADIDGDGEFEPSEVVGSRRIALDETSTPNLVLGQVHIALTEPVAASRDVKFDVRQRQGVAESVYFPAGTLRSLDDPIFDRDFATLGMYDPASFLEEAPTMFYALEEDVAYKIPVVFVHGIGGSAREFAPLVESLDRSRYKPWFFHYPSGGDLDQLAEMFFEVLLSGKVYRSEIMPIIIVAHSMGGLVVREAINRYGSNPSTNRAPLLITLATPFGGHAAAATGEKHSLIVLPSWRDLNPDSAFINDLYRKPLPSFMRHELIYAFQNTKTLKLGENSDGVVALSSQLYPPAQMQASDQFGFDSTHTGILQNEDALVYVRQLMDAVENPFPPDHLEVLRQGGYDVTLGPEYSAKSRYEIRQYGRYLMALSDGTLEPFEANGRRFVDAVNGRKRPRNQDEASWLRFLEEYPELRSMPRGSP